MARYLCLLLFAACCTPYASAQSRNAQAVLERNQVREVSYHGLKLADWPEVETDSQYFLTRTFNRRGYETEFFYANHDHDTGAMTGVGVGQMFYAADTQLVRTENYYGPEKKWQSTIRNRYDSLGRIAAESREADEGYGTTSQMKCTTNDRGLVTREQVMWYNRVVKDCQYTYDAKGRKVLEDYGSTRVRYDSLDRFYLEERKSDAERYLTTKRTEYNERGQKWRVTLKPVKPVTTIGDGGFVELEPGDTVVQIATYLDNGLIDLSLQYINGTLVTVKKNRYRYFAKPEQ